MKNEAARPVRPAAGSLQALVTMTVIPFQTLNSMSCSYPITCQYQINRLTRTYHNEQRNHNQGKSLSLERQAYMSEDLCAQLMRWRMRYRQMVYRGKQGY